MNRIWTLTESERWPSGRCIPGKRENGGESHRRTIRFGEVDNVSDFGYTEHEVQVRQSRDIKQESGAYEKIWMEM